MFVKRTFTYLAVSIIRGRKGGVVAGREGQGGTGGQARSGIELSK